MTPKRMTPKRKRLWLVVGSHARLGVAGPQVLTPRNHHNVIFY